MLWYEDELEISFLIFLKEVQHTWDKEGIKIWDVAALVDLPKFCCTVLGAAFKTDRRGFHTAAVFQ